MFRDDNEKHRLNFSRSSEKNLSQFSRDLARTRILADLWFKCSEIPFQRQTSPTNISIYYKHRKKVFQKVFLKRMSKKCPKNANYSGVAVISDDLFHICNITCIIILIIPIFFQNFFVFKISILVTFHFLGRHPHHNLVVGFSKCKKEEKKVESGAEVQISKNIRITKINTNKYPNIFV